MSFRQSLLLAYLALFLCAAAAIAQPTVKRTITKSDRFDFGAGGTIAITGAPSGSITITGGQTNEVEIVAKIELAANSQSDLDKLAEITGFFADEGLSRTVISTYGMHTKQLLKRARKKIPKGLAGVAYRIDYTIRVPRYCDLEIDAGAGDLSVTGVEGSLFANLIESNASVELASGTASLTVGKGNADISLAARGWRGRSVTVSVGSGDITLHLPKTLSADIDATVLRTGVIRNDLSSLKPRDRRAPFTEKIISAKSGVGGPPFKLTVGDGSIKLLPAVLN